MKIVAPKVGGAELADGSMLASDGQLAGTLLCYSTQSPFLSDEGAKALSMESAAINFVRGAFSHLQAIAVNKAARCSSK